MDILNMRIVATYTTLPDRYDLLYDSMLSIKNQSCNIETIYLTIPSKVTRLNRVYPALPDKITELCNVVYIETDYGPITKLYGALMNETNPEVIIISCDDDVIYPYNLVEILVKYHKKHADSVICGTGALIGKGLLFANIVSSLQPCKGLTNGFSGFNVDGNGRNVDLIFGVGGVLYLRKFFAPPEKLYDDLFHYSLLDPTIFHNDDVLISGYLCKNKIPRKLFLDIPSVQHASRKSDALSYDLVNMLTRLNKSIKKVQEHGLLLTMEDTNMYETPVFRFSTFIMILVFLILAIIICYRYF